ncbi:MAG: hypothetical protein KAI67_06015 [Candidatus Pacebacteria bacterium]|nr:hypothetical protein [Candidatus Paceibacterota bacterium]
MENCNQNKGTSKNKELTLKDKRTMWFMFCMAIFVYNIVAVILSRSENEFGWSDGNMYNTLFYVLAVLSLIQFIVVIKLNAKIREKSLMLMPNKHTEYYMLPIAFSEAIAIYGLILFLLHGNFQHLILFSSMAIFGLLLSYPKE